jgi:3-hydroxypropanoate dehydrogenase
MAHAINDEALATIFRDAHTHNRWQDKPLSAALLMAIYDLMRWGPTTANTSPARIAFVVTKEAKEKLRPHLLPSNMEKTMAAPATAILAYDLKFPDTMAKLFPHRPEAKDWYTDAAFTEKTAFRNASIQGGYFIIAARALGLD